MTSEQVVAMIVDGSLPKKGAVAVLVSTGMDEKVAETLVKNVKICRTRKTTEPAKPAKVEPNPYTVARAAVRDIGEVLAEKVGNWEQDGDANIYLSEERDRTRLVASKDKSGKLRVWGITAAESPRGRRHIASLADAFAIQQHAKYAMELVKRNA